MLSHWSVIVCAFTHAVMCRKGRLQHHEIDPKTRPRFHWWDWLLFWKYQTPRKTAISWWIAFTFFWGSALFTLGQLLLWCIRQVLQASLALCILFNTYSSDHAHVHAYAFKPWAKTLTIPGVCQYPNEHTLCKG